MAATGGRKFEEPKFIHRINGKEAEQLLMTKGIHGSFLVRTSESDANEYTLSYRDKNRVCHQTFHAAEEGFKVKHLPDEYPTIGELVISMQSHVELDFPMWPSDPAPDKLQPRNFFGRLMKGHAEKLLLDENAQPDRNFLIRSSTSRYDQFALSVRMPERDIVHLLIHHERGKYFMKEPERTTEFDSLKELLDHYLEEGNEGLVHTDGRKIQLKQPMISPWSVDYSIVKPDSKKLLSKKQEVTLEFEQLQSLQSTSSAKSEIGRRPENISKNRYKNILPYDKTRVILKSGPDYINANYLKTDDRLGTYIGCQGPLLQTVTDFWRMIWQEETQFIVMLTNTVEGGKNKCKQYWPRDAGEKMIIDKFIIEIQSALCKTKDYVITKLILEREGETRSVYHCHYVGWPEKTVPKNVDALVKFSDEILRLRPPRNPKPIVAHSSAGIGRTGTYILISMIIDQIQLLGNVPDIFEFAKKLREQRPGMVQTVEHYELIYKATEIYQKEFNKKDFAAEATYQQHPVQSMTTLAKSDLADQGLIIGVAKTK